MSLCSLSIYTRLESKTNNTPIHKNVINSYSVNSADIVLREIFIN
ncbi:hypothetical protein B0O79_3496 [Flavobacteriaceae bacterium MAR_2009_75]|nr:hypothetical protein B0O79_3496 [Flavobacteriaceae bacterium MAR_2009_75]